MFVVKKIIVADDHPLFRDALQGAIRQAFEGIEIVAADSFATLQRVVRSHDDCDLTLLDLHMPGAVGFSALHYLGLQYPQIPVAMISASEEPEVMARAMEFGAAGFIPKSAEVAMIANAIKEIIAGERWLPDGMLERINRLDRGNTDFNKRVATLTPKQFRILMMLTDGNLNKQMADEICVSEATIKAHLTEVYKKLGVNNRTQAATIAAKHLQVEPPDPIGLAGKPPSVLH
ncbi:MAG: response regulator transcription factor [Pseudomonadales bacterium]